MLYTPAHTNTNKSYFRERLRAFSTRGNRLPLSFWNSKIVSRTTYFSSEADRRNSAGWSSFHTKTLIQNNISIPMFIAVLFTIAKIWKQSKCSSVDKWVKKLWDIYTMEFYSAIKKKKI